MECDFKFISINLNLTTGKLIEQCLLKLYAAGANDETQQEFINQSCISGHDSMIRTIKQWFTTTGKPRKNHRIVPKRG